VTSDVRTGSGSRPSSTTVTSTASIAANVTRYRDPVAKPRTAKGRARLTVERLAEVYPGTAAELCALAFKDPFQLLAATILSARALTCG